MKFRINVWISAACLALLSLTSSAVAQTSTPETGDETNEPDAYQALRAAQQRRIEMAVDVAADRKSPEAALDLLRIIAMPARLRGDADTDFAHAAIDVGQRLVASDAKKKAARFFQAADESLGGVLERSSDSDVATRVQVLSSRAFIRAQYLGRIAEAIGDLDAAQKLAPNDTYLQDLRRQLLSDKAAWLAEPNSR